MIKMNTVFKIVSAAALVIPFLFAGVLNAQSVQEEDETFTVHYKNPHNWDEVYIWAWEDEGDNLFDDWPGVPMQEPEEGDVWWSYELPEWVNRVIFNDGDPEDAQQTDDLERNSDGWFDGEQWHDEEPELVEIAELQLIHASANEFASSVDVYINADPAEEEPDFAGIEFQDITGFEEVPHGEEISISITSAGEEEVLLSTEFTFEAQDEYVAIARGEFDEEGEPTSFDIDFHEAQKTSGVEDEVALLLYHAVPDTPIAVDLWIKGDEEPLAQDFEFGDAQGYINVPADLHTLELYITGSDPDDTDPLGVFIYNAEDDGGEAGVLLANGYYAGIDDEDVMGVELMAAYPDGNTAFPENVTSSDYEYDSELPNEIALSQNYPNPFNPVTTIGYELPADTEVVLSVYNTLGQRVKTLVDGQVEAGMHQVSFDGSNLASGVYIYRLQADGEIISNQMTLVK